MDTIFARPNNFIPKVIRKNNTLYLEVPGGSDAHQQPRLFTFPIAKTHVEIIKTDLPRHLLLWAAILPLCEAAGTDRPISDEAAIALLDPILFGTEQDIQALFNENPWDKRQLIAQHADATLLEQGKLFDALKTATEHSDWQLVARYDADRDRARREVTLSDLDTALLKYTGQYLYRSGVPARKPEAVDPNLLPQVLEVITTAEQASAGMELPQKYDEKGHFQIDKQAWNAIQNTIVSALSNTYPNLTGDTIKSVSNLLCSEASSRARKKAQ